MFSALYRQTAALTGLCLKAGCQKMLNRDKGWSEIEDERKTPGM